MMDLIAPIFDLPFVHMIGGTVIAYFLGALWYGRIFLNTWMRIVTTAPKENTPVAMVVQFFGLLAQAYLIGLFSLFPEIYLLCVDALIGVTMLMMLSGTLYQYGNTRDAYRLWGINAGYEVLAIIIIATVIWFA